MFKKDDRARNWSFILYPESAPENWQEQLDEYHVKTVVSPLHDKDIDADGELKKPHYHVMVLFDGKKSYQQVYEMYTLVLCCTIPKKVISASGLARYFCHLDNPEKAQYVTSDIKCFGGVDIKALLSSTDADKYVLIKEIGKFVTEHEIHEFADLWQYALDNDLNEWFPILTNNAYCINALVKSCKYKRREEIM